MRKAIVFSSSRYSIQLDQWLKGLTACSCRSNSRANRWGRERHEWEIRGEEEEEEKEKEWKTKDTADVTNTAAAAAATTSPVKIHLVMKKRSLEEESQCKWRGSRWDEYISQSQLTRLIPRAKVDLHERKTLKGRGRGREKKGNSLVILSSSLCLSLFSSTVYVCLAEWPVTLL